MGYYGNIEGIKTGKKTTIIMSNHNLENEMEIYIYNTKHLPEINGVYKIEVLDNNIDSLERCKKRANEVIQSDYIKGISYYTDYSLIKNEIQNVITNYEPRAKIDNIVVNADIDNNSFVISLSFYIGNNTLPTSVNLLLERSR